MTNTIALEEKRSTVDNFRKWYKENLIDTGYSQKFEEGFVLCVDTETKIVEVAGRVVPIIMAIIPFDGPIGEVLTAAASPIVIACTRMKNRVKKRNVLNAKRKFEADFIKADGSSEKIEIPENSIGTLISDLGGPNKISDVFKGTGMSR